MLRHIVLLTFKNEAPEPQLGRVARRLREHVSGQS
jgi:hypothetical protein